ncbi:MAG: hypothetical protein K9W43_01500 [Candidatus Thorarchaeota archaeon]|nr:hypothetical protein [Candidatus Thorarchaeota archaeon]
MPTTRFDIQDDLEEVQARLYRATGTMLTRKEIKAIISKIGSEQYDLIYQAIKSREKPLDDVIVEKVLSLSEDLGRGSDDLSERIDEITYG